MVAVELVLPKVGVEATLVSIEPVLEVVVEAAEDGGLAMVAAVVAVAVAVVLEVAQLMVVLISQLCHLMEVVELEAELVLEVAPVISQARQSPKC